MKIIPKMYQKNIFTIPYDKLKEKKITTLLFDLDNTLATIDEKYPKDEVVKLILELKKEFKIFLVSNSFKKRVKPFGEKLDIPYLAFTMKPCLFKLNRLLKKEKITPSNVAIIGDQFMTDIALGTKAGFYTILVDTLSLKEFKITSINRYREMKLLAKLKKEKSFKKGEYYE